MSCKLTALLTALWIAFAPSLCVVGTLTHPCECPSTAVDCGACCEGEELGCGCVDEGCSHDGCSNDPCQAVVAPQEESASDIVWATAALVLLPQTALDLGYLQQPCPNDSSGLPDLRKNLPYFLSDLPLRI